MWSLYILIGLGVFVFWFLCSGGYGKIGSFVYRIFADARDEINKEYDDETSSEKDKEEK